MEALWDSLCRDQSQAHAHAVPVWHQDELNTRLAALDSGDEAVSPWEEAR